MNGIVPTSDPATPSPGYVFQLLLPSWLGSLFFHGLLAAAILYLSQIPACQRHHDILGESDGTFRQAGIQFLPPGPAGGTEGTGTDAESPVGGAGENFSAPPQKPITASNFPESKSSLPAVSSPPVPLNLPQSSPSSTLIGPGHLSSPVSSGLGQVVQSALPGGLGSGTGLGSRGTGGGTGGGNGTGGGGGTTFVGITGKGKTFIYVIDRSFSMANDHALQAAKLELLASLQQLDETQQFQIIFYNNEYVKLNPRGGRFDFFRGTDPQRLMVTEQIREITPAAGTRHLPAIQEALNDKPDVIFLLSDGASESALDRKDLESIRQQNRHGTHIHCIEFGRGEKSPRGDPGNFLRILSQENQGQYVYRNLKAGF